MSESVEKLKLMESDPIYAPVDLFKLMESDPIYGAAASFAAMLVFKTLVRFMWAPWVT